MSEIMNCPFCNGEATVGANEYYDGANTFYIYCTNCGVEQTATKIRTDEAIAAWNRRADVADTNVGDKPLTRDEFLEKTAQLCVEVAEFYEQGVIAFESCGDLRVHLTPKKFFETFNGFGEQKRYGGGELSKFFATERGIEYFCLALVPKE